MKKNFFSYYQLICVDILIIMMYYKKEYPCLSHDFKYLTVFTLILGIQNTDLFYLVSLA